MHWFILFHLKYCHNSTQALSKLLLRVEQMNTVPRHAKKDKKEELTGKQKFSELFSTFQEFKRPDLGLQKNVISRFRHEKKHF